MPQVGESFSAMLCGYAPCQFCCGIFLNGGLTTEKILYLPDCRKSGGLRMNMLAVQFMPIHNDKFSTPGMLLVLYAPRDCTTRGAEAAW